MSKLSTAVICALGVVSTSAFAIWEDWEFKPNLGFDAGLKIQRFDSGFGKEHFKENYPATNFYMGTIFYKYLGLEVGYEHMYSQEKKQFYSGLTPVLGFDFAGNRDEKLYFSDVFTSGWNLNLMGYYPICPRTKTDLIGTLGVSWLKMHYDTVPVLDANPATPVAYFESDRRGLLRLGVGLRQMITDNFGARLQFMWEDTSKLGASIVVPVGQGGNPNPTSASDFYTVNPKDSYFVGLGFFFQIM